MRRSEVRFRGANRTRYAQCATFSGWPSLEDWRIARIAVFSRASDRAGHFAALMCIMVLIRQLPVLGMAPLALITFAPSALFTNARKAFTAGEQACTFWQQYDADPRRRRFQHYRDKVVAHVGKRDPTIPAPLVRELRTYADGTADVLTRLARRACIGTRLHHSSCCWGGRHCQVEVD
jgi:hypothetical protein